MHPVHNIHALHRAHIAILNRSVENSELLGLRPLARYLKTRIGAVDLTELRRLAVERLIPSVKLRGEKGADVFAFDGPAVEAALLARARELPAAAPTKGCSMTSGLPRFCPPPRELPPDPTPAPVGDSVGKDTIDDELLAALPWAIRKLRQHCVTWRDQDELDRLGVPGHPADDASRRRP